MSFGALNGVRVIDLTTRLAGPYGSMILADHGAEVIKVEPPGDGDLSRLYPVYHKDDLEKTLSGYFQSINRNKKSICLDLKSKEGRDVLLELIKSADVLVENYRAGTMEKWGFSYEALSEINPKLVYGSLRGFGDPRGGKSPYVEWPSYDIVAQAMGGIMAITGPDSETPMKVGPGIGDILPGMNLAMGVLMALFRAQRTRKGQYVDVSMVDSILALCERVIYHHAMTGEIPKPEGNHHPVICPYGVFVAKDGHVTIAAPDDALFTKFCECLERPDLVEDERFKDYVERYKNKKPLIDIINQITAQLTKEELGELLGGEIPFGPVMDIAEIVANSHFAAREMLVEVDQPGSQYKTRLAGAPIKLSDTPGGVNSRAPFHGENTRELLAEAGIDAETVDKVLEVLNK